MAKVSNDFASELAQVVGADNVLTDPADRWTYGYDNSRKHAAPEIVAFAVEHAQVKEIVTLCNRYRVPLVVRGRGTGTTGSAIPLRGGLVLSLERMDRIVSDMLFLAQASHASQALKFEELSLGTETRRVCDYFDVIAEEARIATTVKGDAIILGNRLMVQRAISNLLSNALRHSTTGGNGSC